MSVKSFRVLVVCTGNTCRSSMAEGFLRNMLNQVQATEVWVGSAGTHTGNGYPASEEAVAAARELQVDISEHQSTILTEDLIAKSDIILVMSGRHKQSIVSLVPDAMEKTFLLGEFRGVGGSPEIADPVGQPLSVFRRCAEEIMEGLKGFVARLPELRDRFSPKVVDFVVGTDHRGIAIKTKLIGVLNRLGLSWEDLGSFSSESCDYPEYAFKVGEAVAQGKARRGALVCGTGLGMAMAANKVRGVRAGVITNSYLAKMSRSHNNANVIVLCETTTEAEMEQIMDIWWRTEFEGGRHAKRVDMIMQYEK